VRLQNHLHLYHLDRSAAWADAGVDPIDFPEAPTKALPIALQKANLTINDIAQFEFNEAFSVVVRIAEKTCGIDGSKINVNGCAHLLHVFYPSHSILRGAVALGHAIGNSGSRIIVSLVHSLKSGEYGAAGICNGVCVL
jgi:acetyl-CoA C-acetyltransferase